VPLNSCAPACVTALANPVTNSARRSRLPSRAASRIEGSRSHRVPSLLSSRRAPFPPPCNHPTAPHGNLFTHLEGTAPAVSWLSSPEPMGAAGANSRQEIISWLVSEKIAPKRSPYGHGALCACPSGRALTRLPISQPRGAGAVSQGSPRGLVGPFSLGKKRDGFGAGGGGVGAPEPVPVPSRGTGVLGAGAGLPEQGAQSLGLRWFWGRSSFFFPVSQGEI